MLRWGEEAGNRMEISIYILSQQCFCSCLCVCIGEWFSRFLITTFISRGCVKESTCNAGDMVSILGWEDPLEESMATYSSIPAWKIPWTEEPGRLRSMDCKESDTTEVNMNMNYISSGSKRGYSSLPCAGVSLRWLLLLQSIGPRLHGVSNFSPQA